MASFQTTRKCISRQLTAIAVDIILYEDYIWNPNSTTNPTAIIKLATYVNIFKEENGCKSSMFKWVDTLPFTFSQMNDGGCNYLDGVASSKLFKDLAQNELVNIVNSYLNNYGYRAMIINVYTQPFPNPLVPPCPINTRFNGTFSYYGSGLFRDRYGRWASRQPISIPVI